MTGAILDATGLAVVNIILVVTLITYALGNFKSIGLLLESVSGDVISFPVGIFLLGLIMGIYESLAGMRGDCWWSRGIGRALIWLSWMHECPRMHDCRRRRRMNCSGPCC
ncbi:MAG: hypothetical protein ACE1Y4_05410 [Lysobacterales bacterium]